MATGSLAGNVCLSASSRSSSICANVAADALCALLSSAITCGLLIRPILCVVPFLYLLAAKRCCRCKPPNLALCSFLRIKLRLNESPGPRMPGLCGQLSAHIMRGCKRAPLVFIRRPLTVGVCARLLTRHEKSSSRLDSSNVRRQSGKQISLRNSAGPVASSSVTTVID